MTGLINYRKILLSAVVITFVTSLVFAGTNAFFSDTETSTGNTFTAGEIDLTVDSVAHYNGLVCFEDQWVPETAVEWDGQDQQLVDDDDGESLQDEIDDFNSDNPNNFPQAGEACAGTWALTDLGPTHQFFNYGDLKPGDNGENTLSLHLETNDGYVCAVINNLVDDDNGLTEPEAESGDNTGGDGEGELSSELHFFAWADDGNNVYEQGELPLFSNTEGPASDILDGISYDLFTPATGQAMGAGETAYIGLYWCYGDITVSGTDISCDGGPVSNMTQTDSMTADISFYVEQSRNNDAFECPSPDGFEQDRERVGAVLGAYTEPASEQCNLLVNGVDDAPNSYATVQAAVDASEQGDVICVDTGTYVEDVTVDEDVTILGLHDPKGSDKATIDGRVDFDVDGITLSGLEVTNPDAGYGVVINGVSDTELSYNSFVNIGTSLSAGSAQAIYFSDGVTDASGLSIHDNMIDNVGNLSLVANGGTSAKGIFVGDSSPNGDLSGLVIEDNMITDVFASTATFATGGRGAYGILINLGAQTISPVITHNTIESLEGLWVHAVGLEGDTPGASVTHNDIADLTEHKGGTDGFGVFFEANPGADTTVVNVNNFAADMPFGVGIHSGNPVVTVDAENNWWGDTDPSDDVFEGLGTIDYTPFETAAFPAS